MSRYNRCPFTTGPRLRAAGGWRVNIAGCSISFSGDMSNQYQALGKLAVDSDLLVINNAIPEKAQGAARNLHMPPPKLVK
jgi:ribonuclease BN (tRNA processing enzyme)